jgi:hypothetical protein
MMLKSKALPVLAFVLITLSSLAQQSAPEPHGAIASAYQPKFAGDKARSDAEFAALGYMRTVVTAEKLYNRKHGHYAESLVALVGSGSFTRRMIQFDRGNYRVSFRPSPQGYELALAPKEFSPERRAFFVDETGEFRAEEGKAANEHSPALK